MIKNVHKFLKIIICFGILIMVFTGVSTEVSAASKVKLNKTKVTLIKGQSTTLKIKGTKSKVKWYTSNKKVATVSKGKVVAKKNGNAVITAKVKNKKYTCKVKVETPSISKKSAVLSVKESVSIKMNGTSQKVTWSTNNKKVATVSKGKIVAHKKGSAVITAKVGNKKYTCKVTVESPSLSKTSIALQEGKSYTLSVKGTKRKVSWTSNNNKVCKVKNGKITAGTAGNAVITAKVGTKKYTCKVKVNKVAVAPGTNSNPNPNPAPNPTPNPSPNPNPAPTPDPQPPVNTLEQNYDKLATYIQNHASGESSDFKVIEAGTDTDGVVIGYNEKTNLFGFMVTVWEMDNEYGLVVFIDPNKMDSLKVEYSVYSTPSGDPLNTKAYFNPKTFNKATKLNFISLSSMNAEKLDDTTQEIANNATQSAFDRWNKVISDAVGLSFADLGFTAYK